MVLMNARMLDAAEFLDIWRLDELRGITDEGDLIADWRARDLHAVD